MKRFISVLLLLLCNVYVNAQGKKIDSLNILIAKATSDTQRINLSVEKINALINVDFDSAITFANNVIQDAKAISYTKGEANARTVQTFAYCYKGEYPIAKKNLEIAQNLVARIKDSIGFVKVFNGYGVMYSMQNKYDSALTFYRQAMDIQQLQTNLGLLSMVYQNTAIAYQQQSNYPQALVYYQKAQSIAEKENDEEGEAYIYLNMAITFTIIDDAPRAEQSFMKAIDLAKRLNLKTVEAYAYSNLSSLYGNMHKPDKEYDFGMKAATLAGDIGDLGIEASSLSRAAVALAEQDKFEDAEKISRRSLNIADSSKQLLNIYQTYANMGLILKMQKKYSQAIPYYEKAFRSLTDADLYDRQVAGSYLSFSECYENTGNYSKALTAYKTAARIGDSLSNKENIRKATELTLNAEFDKKQQIAKAEQQKKDEIAKTKQTALIIGLVLTFILALVAFNGFRNKRRSNFLLYKQKEEIQIALKELRITQAQLVQSEKMALLGELTAGIAHEIQNPLNFVNNFSELNTELIDELQAEKKSEFRDFKNEDEILNDIKANEQKINHHGKRADAIVKGMLQHSRISTGRKESTDMNALVDEYLRLSYHGMRAKDNSFNVTLKTELDKTIGKIDIIPPDLGRVLLNIFNNAFYSVNEKKKKVGDAYEPLVSVSTKRIGNKIEIRVRDNGNGIPQKVLDKIYQPFFTTKPTGEGTGLGLSLSYDIITKEHGGTIRAETNEGEFAEFIIQLPI